MSLIYGKNVICYNVEGINEIDIVKSAIFKEIIDEFIISTTNPLVVGYHLSSDKIAEFISTCVNNILWKIPFDIKQAKKVFTQVKDLSISSLDKLISDIYDYYRSKNRYNLYAIPYINDSRSLTINNENNLAVITLYRKIHTYLVNDTYHVYRQLSAAFNSSLGYTPIKFQLNHKKQVKFITRVILNPPFIIETAANVRKDTFILESSPFTEEINEELLCFPLLVGKQKCNFYVTPKYIHLGVCLVNLFELDKDYSESADTLCFFGVNNKELNNKIYLNNGKYLGFISDSKSNDYFGYAKKMVLTLHNLANIDKGYLPIHGAMVELLFENNKSINIMMMGDSGAGKSETIEALKTVSNNTIKDVKVIFDDMGYIYQNKEGNIVASGTEIGAFVRLDDLQTGYAYHEIDRTIFVNPTRTNGRIIIPVSSYEYISSDHKIDYFFYVNNFEDPKDKIVIYDSATKNKDVFVNAKRAAMNTTNEIGISTTFFANPFGPLQRKEESTILIDKYFKEMDKQNIKVGILYSRLSFGKEKTLEAAQELINEINK
jgi:hypothetical protein